MYKIYRWSKKSFESKLNPVSEEILNMSVVFNDDGFNMVYLTDSNGYVLLGYASDMIKETQKLGFGMRRDADISAYAFENKVSAMWLEGKAVYTCESNESGGQFTKPVQSVLLGKNKIWGRIRTSENPYKMYCDSGYIDIEDVSVPIVKQISKITQEQKKQYTDGERAYEYSKREMLSALGSGELLKRLDAIELRLDGIMDNISKFINKMEESNNE